MKTLTKITFRQKNHFLTDKKGICINFVNEINNNTFFAFGISTINQIKHTNRYYAIKNIKTLSILWIIIQLFFQKIKDHYYAMRYKITHGN